MSAKARLLWSILGILVISSLVSNIYLVRTALDLQDQINRGSDTAAQALDNAVAQMEALETQEFTLVVPIDEEIEIDATIPFDEEFSIPINTSVPIDMDVSVPLRLGVLGTVDLDIPINVDVPLDLTVPIRIQRDVPIQTIVPVKLDVPITLSLKGTNLASQLDEWQTILVQLRRNLPQAGTN